MSPGEVDPRVVRRHLAALRSVVAGLRRHVGRPLASLASDDDHRWAVERGLQLAAQNVLDVATHLSAAMGRDAPDYATAILALGSTGVLPTEFAAELAPLAGFRDILVHGYLEVDGERLHEVLNSRLEDLERFARLVDAFLDGTAGR